MNLSELLKRVANLQPSWTSENTPEMQERGHLIRKAIPATLKASVGQLQDAIAPYGDELKIEGSDGKGKKGQAPWVRLFSHRLSPSAKTGFYLVIHFSADGAKCYFTLGTGTSSYKAKRGLMYDDSDEILKRTDWMVRSLESSGAELTSFTDKMSIGSSLKSTKKFEDGTAICRSVRVDELTDELAFDLLTRLLKFLSIIYQSVDRRDHLPDSDALTIQLEASVSEKHRDLALGQGRGLNSEQKKAVELRAMDVVKKALLSDGYELTDTSANNSYDFLATRDGRELKVEVKGTTSCLCNAVCMTSNEVKLHHDEKGETALGIVSSIVLDESAGLCRGKGGILELAIPWDITDWHCEPVTYVVRRNPKASVN